VCVAKYTSFGARNIGPGSGGANARYVAVTGHVMYQDFSV